MGAGKQWLGRAAANLAAAAFRCEPLGRVCDWLAVQRRRARRRRIEQRLRQAGLYGDEVAFGPFRGLRYPPGVWAGSRFEKIIGAYEAELHPVLETICRAACTCVINIGCAEGYYAVGLARRLPGAVVCAFELDAARRQACADLARLNGVQDRLRLAGQCDHAALRALSPGARPLVVCDCEGAELELLDPAAVPWLACADLLVEVHDFKNRSISGALRQRFAATHDLQVIPTAGLAYANYPVLRQLTFPEIYAMVGEERAELMEWFFFTARRGAA